MSFDFHHRINYNNGSVIAGEQAITLTNGIYDDDLSHTNIIDGTVEIYSGTNKTGTQITDFTLTDSLDNIYVKHLYVAANYETLYVCFSSYGDIVMADDINELQDAVTEVDGNVSSLGNQVTGIGNNIGDLSNLETADQTSLVAAINEANQNGGAGGIVVVDTVAEMVDTGRVYLYNGTESGYTSGHWYYYDTDSSAWTDGGEYTGWLTVDTAVETYLQENAQEIGTLTITVGETTYTYNGSSAVTITLPVYDGSTT